MRGFERWTEEEERELSVLYWEDYTDDEIANELGRSAKAVGARRKALGLHRRAGAKESNKVYTIYKGDEYYTNGTVKEIAEKTGKTVSTVYRWIQGRGGYNAIREE